jgi:hypothetical protein
VKGRGLTFFELAQFDSRTSHSRPIEMFFQYFDASLLIFTTKSLNNRPMIFFRFLLGPAAPIAAKPGFVPELFAPAHCLRSVALS